MTYPTERNGQTDSDGKNTKKAAKRRKIRYPGQSIRKPNQVAAIYRKHTGAKVADKATEDRLKRRGPSTSVRNGGDQFIW